MMQCRFVLFVVAVCFAGACGGGSTPASSSPANVAGNWAGTFQFTAADGTRVSAPLTMTLTQSGANVSGSWTAAAQPASSGTVAGTVTATSFSGTFTFVASVTTTCTGTFPVSGAAGGSSVSWTSPAITGNCSNLPTSITIAAQIR
jgi:hypothetical protein